MSLLGLAQRNPARIGGPPAWRRRGLALIGAFAAFAAFCTSPAAAEPVRLLAFGDSLVAGYGLAPSAAFPAQLQRALRAEGYEVAVINAGQSGDTTAAGRGRLEWSLADKPDAVLLELGANDALRGLEPEQAFDNLDAILTRLKAENLPVLLAGMLASRNLGADYRRAFDRVFPRLAEKHDVPLYPFFLEGVALDPELNQADGIHPNERGVAVIVERILPYVIELVERAKANG